MAGVSFVLGIIGNVISILMFASPMKTFKRVIKKKSTENFKGLPYITTLLSTSLWTFYGLLKPGGLLVVTVNGAGAALHIFYVLLFIIYAPKPVKVSSLNMVGVLDIGFLGVVIAVTLLALHGHTRLTFVGILCAGLTIGMYAAPLSAMRTVIRMRSVEYMPFLLTFFQFLNGGVWTAYAVLVQDVYIAVPNGIGLILGVAQLSLYLIYRNKSMPTTKSIEEGKAEQSSAHDCKGVIEMQEFDDENGDSRMNENLKKGKSLPKTSHAREYSDKLIKTLSMSQYAMSLYNEYNFDIDAKENM